MQLMLSLRCSVFFGGGAVGARFLGRGILCETKGRCGSWQGEGRDRNPDVIDSSLVGTTAGSPPTIPSTVGAVSSELGRSGGVDRGESVESGGYQARATRWVPSSG